MFDGVAGPHLVILFRLSPCRAMLAGQGLTGKSSMFRCVLGLFVLLLPLFAAPAHAAQCGGDFQSFLATMAREAQAQGVSRGVIDQAFAGVSQDQGVLSFEVNGQLVK